MQNYDAVFKDSFSLFKDKSLRFLGIENDARITAILSTEKREIQVLSGKVARGEEISELDLVFLPMCSSKTKTTVELLERGIALAARLPSSGQKIAGLMMVLSDKLVEEKELERIWEEFMDMTKLKVLQVAEKVGMKKAAIGMMREGIDIQLISKITGLSPEELQKLASKPA